MRGRSRYACRVVSESTSRVPAWSVPVGVLAGGRPRLGHPVLGLYVPNAFICVRQVPPESGNWADWRPLGIRVAER